MDDEYDVLVIGGGMAGLVAGITAAQSEASVLVIKHGDGATAMSSGAIDLAGYLRGGSTTFINAAEGIEAYSQIYPYHPYAVLCSEKSNDLKDDVSEIVNWISNLLEGTASEVTGDLDMTFMPLSYLGTRKPTSMVQKTMFTEKLANSEEILLIAGIKGLSDFNPSAASKTIMESVISTGSGPTKIVHTSITCSPFEKEFNISPIELARYIETEEGFKQFCGELKKQTSQLGATIVGIPPVLGLKDPLKVREKLQQEVGASVFEFLAFPPSVPGYRLQRSLELVLLREGGRLLQGHKATSFTMEDNRISSVEIESPRRKYMIHPKTVVLASGKYIGGGLLSNGLGLNESVFNLPVVDGHRQPVANTRPRTLTDVVSIQIDGHELFECGIAFDERYRPLGNQGKPFAENLFAAGSILSGYNYPSEKSGLGVALITGRKAGRFAMNTIEEETR